MERPQLFGCGAITWALLIGIVLVVLAGGVLMPSTKRARIDIEKLRHQYDQDKALAASATAPSTHPSTQP